MDGTYRPSPLHCGSYVATEKQPVALYGVENLVVVATDDAVLVAGAMTATALRRLVHKLKEVAPAATASQIGNQPLLANPQHG
jgi:hypothetical protein